MAIKPHPKFGEIKDALLPFAKLGLPYKGICYRCTDPQFAREIISGAGSQLYGARWTPIGSFPTVYLCETAEAALEEFFARGRRMRLPDHKSLPMVMAGVNVKVARLLDFTGAEMQAIISSFCEAEKTHWRTIQNRREAATQAIGRAAFELGLSGIITESQVTTGKVIVIFPENLTENETLSVPNLHRL